MVAPRASTTAKLQRSAPASAGAKAPAIAVCRRARSAALHAAGAGVGWRGTVSVANGAVPRGGRGRVHTHAAKPMTAQSSRNATSRRLRPRERLDLLLKLPLLFTQSVDIGTHRAHLCRNLRSFA